MDVETAACLSFRNLRSESHVIAFLHGKRADNPLCEHEAVGCFESVDGKELDFVLLENLVVERKVAHLVVAILDLTAGLGDEMHALGAEVVELRERSRLMITLLVGGTEQTEVIADYVIFKLAHGVELHAGLLLEKFERAAE